MKKGFEKQLRANTFTSIYTCFCHFNWQLYSEEMTLKEVLNGFLTSLKDNEELYYSQ